MHGTDHYAMQPAGGEESASRMTAEADGQWQTDEVSIRRAKNGGFIVRCSKSMTPQPKDGPGFKSDEYAYTSPQEALAFAASELGAGTAPKSHEAEMAAGETRDIY